MDRNEAQQAKSAELVAGPREKKYGHPKDNYRRIAKIWSAVLGIDVTPTQAVLCELGVKFSRLIQTPDDEDTQVDVHGYIKVLQRLLDPNDQPGYKVRITYEKAWVPEKDLAPWPDSSPFYTLKDGATPAGHVYPDGSVEGTLDEALSKEPPHVDYFTGPKSDSRRNPCGQ